MARHGTFKTGATPLTATAAVEPTCESVGCYGEAVLVLELDLHEQILRQTSCIVPIHRAQAMRAYTKVKLQRLYVSNAYLVD